MSHPSSGQITLQRLVLLAAALGIAALGWYMLGDSESVSAEETTSATSGSKASMGNETLATVGGVAITAAEVEEAAAAQLMKVNRDRHQILSDTVKGKVQEKLLEAEAKKRGISRDELLEAEVNSKVAEVTDADIDAFYEERKAQIGRPKEQVESQIRAYLQREGPAKAMQDLIARLEESHEVKYLMEPFRVQVAAEGPSKGPEGAPVTIVEFSDFECPFCSRVNPTLKQIQDEYGDKVRIVFRQFPLAMHPNAPKAGEASLCAHDQGKFWEMHDAMFADQRNLAVDKLKEKAATIEGLDTEAFNTCLDAGGYAETVSRDLAAGTEAGVSGTPAFFINGRFINGAAAFENFAEIIDDELKNNS